MTGFSAPPSLEDFQAIAQAAWETIPEALRAMTEGVVFQIEEFPDEETCRMMELESPFDLMGLYHGVPFGERGGNPVVEDIDRIFLYRRPILDYWCETGEDLTHLIRHVVIHEIGHHFGLSDEDMHRIEDAD